MEESVKIAVRWRPIPGNDENNDKIILKKLTKNMIGVNGYTFLFDEVLDGSTQNQVYTDLAKPMVDKAINGFNFTLLAYGQTGTGKTYTMGFENNEDVERYGITMRAIADIFSRPNSEKMKVSLSFIEIYNEQAFDLLAERPTEPLNVKGHKNSLALKKPVKNLSDAQLILENCMKNRRVRQTKMNPNSSRSHGILTIHIEVQTDERQTKATINLVDLAGSEGVRRTSHKGEALLEGNHINHGLLCIARVMKALSRKGDLIPYRDSILTTVLQNSLNLRSYLILLACITPYQKDSSQTLSTLRFTASAKSMKITPHLNAIINNYKKSNTPVRTPGAQLKLTPGSMSKTTKELFKSPLPLRSNPNDGCSSFKSRQTLSTSKPAVWTNQRFSTPATLKSKTNPTKWNRYAATPGTSNMNNKSKTAQNLFPESNTTVPSNKDDSFDGFAMNISTSTVIGPDPSKIDDHRSEIPSGLSFSPFLNRVDQLITERLGPIISTLQTTMNIQRDETRVPVPTESIRSIAQQMIHCIPKTEPEDINPELNESISLIAPPSTPVNVKRVKIMPIQEESKPVSTMRRSTRISMRSVRVSGERNNIEQSQLRRSRRISMMVERAPLADIPIPNVKPESRKSTLLEHFERLSIGSNENAKSSHMEFVLNILNKGTLKDLQILPMIGCKTAYQIYTYRSTNGAFETIESLKDMPFWSEKTYQRFVRQNNL